jgi:hypothetical protein
MDLFLPTRVPLVNPDRSVEQTWLGFFQGLMRKFQQSAVESVFLLADQPTLGPNDAGLVAIVADYGHCVRWTGEYWTFLTGDVGNGQYAVFAITPQEQYWRPCDGSTYTYLVVNGPRLTTATFTTGVSASTYFRI